MSEKVSGVKPLRELVALVAGPRTWSDNRKSWLAKAARAAGISYRQTKSLFYGEIKDRNHKSARLMRDAAEALAQRYETVAGGMQSVDPDFYGEVAARHLELARALRNLGGPGDGEEK